MESTIIDLRNVDDIKDVKGAVEKVCCSNGLICSNDKYELPQRMSYRHLMELLEERLKGLSYYGTVIRGLPKLVFKGRAWWTEPGLVVKNREGEVVLLVKKNKIERLYATIPELLVIMRHDEKYFDDMYARYEYMVQEDDYFRTMEERRRWW